MNPTEAVKHLNANGWTETALSLKLGCSQSTINRIKHGTRPHFELGLILVKMAQRTRPRARK